MRQVVGITPQRLAVLNKAAKLPTSMSAPVKSNDEGGTTLEDTVEVRCCCCSVKLMRRCLCQVQPVGSIVSHLAHALS